MAEIVFTKEQQETLNTYPIAAWKYPRVLVGIPMERAISHADKVFWQFMAIAKQGPAFLPIPYMRTDLYRNKAAANLLQSDFTHLLMLDVDHIHPVNIIQQLARWVLLDRKKFQVIGGLNFRRGEPYEPCAFQVDNNGDIYTMAEWEQGLVKVDALGTGSILIAREVFEQLEPPWFFNDYSEAWKDNYPGEDIGFSAKCRAAGIGLYVDTTTTSPHMIDSQVTEETYRSYFDRWIGKTGNEVIGEDEMRKRGLK